MFLINELRKNVYYDSVTLMLVSKKILESDGIIDASLMMGTEENIEILKNSGLLKEKIESSPNDLVICIKAETEERAREVLKNIDRFFQEIKQGKEEKPGSIEEALEILPDANLALISVAGRYAGYVAEEALKHNLNVKIFSDNVPIEQEIKLKKLGAEKGLFVMGPDAGTSIINGIPLAFANVVNRGRIGIVGASGTGIQETSVIISKNGAGISQAVGIGTHDLSKEVGGIMAEFSLKQLDDDNDTDIILFISKPPAPEIADKLLGFIKNKINKKVVVHFIGADESIKSKYPDIIFADNLFEASLITVYLSQGKDIKEAREIIKQRVNYAKEEAKKIKGLTGKYIRGLFSGGTLCFEAMMIAREIIGNVYSNISVEPEYKIKDAWRSIENTFIDMGSDEYTVGRLHPMIDYELRIKRLIQEAKDPETKVILFDIVLGYGSHPDPASEVVPAVKEAKKIAEQQGRNILFVAYVLGTEKDIQDYNKQRSSLEDAGVIVCNSNVESAALACSVL